MGEYDLQLSGDGSIVMYFGYTGHFTNFDLFNRWLRSYIAFGRAKTLINKVEALQSSHKGLSLRLMSPRGVLQEADLTALNCEPRYSQGVPFGPLFQAF